MRSVSLRTANAEFQEEVQYSRPQLPDESPEIIFGAESRPPSGSPSAVTQAPSGRDMAMASMAMYEREQEGARAVARVVGMG